MDDTEKMITKLHLAVMLQEQVLRKVVELVLNLDDRVEQLEGGDDNGGRSTETKV